jgi:REP element-mobilizing transposase RayT
VHERTIPIPAEISPSTEHAGWRKRGYLPHYDATGAVQHIVFRLADALPAKLAARLERAPVKDRWDAAERALDEGSGSRALVDDRIAALVTDSLNHFDGLRYRLLAWCVMPTHVHVLAEQAQGWPLGGVVHAWKSFTANRANMILGGTGRFWAPDYFDRSMRSDAQVEAAFAYIEHNPVAAGLCTAAEAWPWSSAYPERRLRGEPR